MLLSPSSVVGDEPEDTHNTGGRKGSNAELLGITRITPRLAAYGCLQVSKLRVTSIQ